LTDIYSVVSITANATVTLLESMLYSS